MSSNHLEGVKQMNNLHITDVKTICMHGNLLSKYAGRELRKVYDFMDFGMRDFMPGGKEESIMDTTGDMIELIKSNKISYIFLTHPKRWASGNTGWLLII